MKLSFSCSCRELLQERPGTGETVSSLTELKNENRLLASLPREDYERLAPHLKPVELKLRETLHHPHEPIRSVYFPNRGSIISIVALSEDGTTIEIGVVGHEGMAGISIFMGVESTPNQAIVQLSGGGGMRISADVLRAEFSRGGALQRALLRYMHALFTQVSQTAVCNRLHTVEERLIRWLLMSHDRAGSDDLHLTQEFIAQMLGTRRAGVTIAAGTLQQAGLITYPSRAHQDSRPRKFRKLGVRMLPGSQRRLRPHIQVTANYRASRCSAINRASNFLNF